MSPDYLRNILPPTYVGQPNIKKQLFPKCFKEMELPHREHPSLHIIK